MARRGFEDFAECLLVGLLIALASAPVITAAPAFAAGCRAVRRSSVDVSRPLWTSFWADFRELTRGGVAFSVLVSGLAVLFTAELVVAPVVPGTKFLVPALGVLAAFVAVVALRTCAVIAERRGGWRRAVLAAARGTVARPWGGAVLAGAASVAAVLVWMQPLLAMVVGGPLALATVASGLRR